jgi:ABC-2 type transport system permease protein
MFPYRGMPEWAQWIGEFLPLTHFLRIIRAVMLKGADLSEIGFEVSILCVFILAYAGLALLRFRRTLD